MKIYSLFILNKAGGLIYQNDFNPKLNKLSANDYLVLAGTLHGVHAIASRLNQTISGKEKLESQSNENTGQNNSIISTGRSQNSNSNKTGLQSIETDLFNLYVFQTLSGIKFILITSTNPVVHQLQHLGDGPGTSAPSKGELSRQFDLANDFFKQVYVIYGDYVMKDPFYSLDMPIKSVLFDGKVRELVANQ